MALKDTNMTRNIYVYVYICMYISVSSNKCQDSNKYHTTDTQIRISVASF